MFDVTRILNSIEQSDGQTAEDLLPLAYDELRKLAATKRANEKARQTLQETALVHETKMIAAAAAIIALWSRAASTPVPA